MTRPGAQGRRDAVREARGALADLSRGRAAYADPADEDAHRAMRRKLVAAMRRVVREVVRSERKA